MKDQLKVLKAENKGKGSTKGSTAADELHYLMVVGGRLDQRSINRRCPGTIAFGH